LRVFIGVPVGDQCQRQINELLCNAVPGKRAWRWIPEEQRHLTLAFIGELPTARGAALARRFPAVYDFVKPFQYRFTALERFPHPAARLIALTGKPTQPMNGLVAATLGFLQRERIPHDQKPFRSHITLARTPGPRPGSAPLDVTADISLDIGRVVLYRSTLDRSGSTYSVLATSRLRGPAPSNR
jgi:2'-5' RNA ligase